MVNVKYKLNKSYANIFSITSNFSLLSNKNPKGSKFNFKPLLCLISASFFVFLGIYFLGEYQLQENKDNIIHLAWAENLNGTDNGDNINGTTNQDTIKGLNGNDTIKGNEAGDDISGGSGDDFIYGNDGRDVLKGKAGNDEIDGGDGHDRIYGDRGNDMLIGGKGNDTLTGGLGSDTFICGEGTDTITDFNSTQKDNLPENDCETKEESNNAAITTPTVKEQEKPKNSDGGFFGLFK
jgi:hypothetical protein